MDADMAEAYRGLGLSLLKTGQPSGGQKALRTYLELKPDASDAAMIRMMLPKEVTEQ
jgi:regulator of sirC expression with transglutaminase-like and TPR domain